MIRTNQIAKGQVALSYNGKPVGQFSRASNGVWTFVPRVATTYSATVLREITKRLSTLNVDGASGGT